MQLLPLARASGSWSGGESVSAPGTNRPYVSDHASGATSSGLFPEITVAALLAVRILPSVSATMTPSARLSRMLRIMRACRRSSRSRERFPRTTTRPTMSSHATAAVRPSNSGSQVRSELICAAVGRTATRQR
jgi:hypothetical protein